MCSEVGLPDARIVDPVYMVYYLLLPSHLERAAGEASWDTSGPRYELTGDGVPEYRGPFWDPNNIPGMAIRQSRLYERTRGLWARSEEEKTRLAIALLVALRDRVRERYAAPLTVLYWSDESERFGRVLTAAEAAGLRVLDAFDLMPPDDVDVYTIPNDGHPNALAHRYLGPELARDFAHAHRGVSR